MGTRENGCAGSTQLSAAAPQVDKGVDFANYFCTYGYLYHQKEMLSDRVRMDAYFHAVSRNKHHFRDKAVLDVGTGSGILAIWCAQAGARKVYAVEATKMADHARELVKGNGVEDIVEVIEGSMEDVVLPEKVDVIISEWMGYFLLRESMFDSVICARDRWLKPDGVMYPSHARMWLAPIRSGLTDQKMDEVNCSMNDWRSFTAETESYYGVNMSVLTKAYREENEKYFLKTSLWCNLDPHQIIGTPAVIKEMDCLQATVDEIRTITAQVVHPINIDRSRISAYAGWFDVQFKGSEQNPAKDEVELNTAPDKDGGTHWGQQVFLVNPPIRVNEGDKVNVSFKMSRAKQYHRLMDIEIISELELSSGKRFPPVTTKVAIE
ncbi:protein arginine methyltransferase 10 [Carex rostrata]